MRKPLCAATSRSSRGRHDIRRQEAAYSAEGLSLDFFRDYNVSWKDPAKYFASPHQINTSRLRGCEAAQFGVLYGQGRGEDQKTARN